METSNDIDPVAFWTFDDVPNSNVASDTAGKTNGLYSAGVDLGHEGQTSKQSSAYFNGESSYVVIPYTPLLNSADFTISATVNPSARSGEDQSESAESIVENFAETSEQTVVIGGYGLERHWIGPNERLQVMVDQWESPMMIVGCPLRTSDITFISSFTSWPFTVKNLVNCCNLIYLMHLWIQK